MTLLEEKAVKNVADILNLAFEHPASRRMLVVFDARTPLARLLASAYRAARPEADFLEFETTTPDEILARIDGLAPKDLVVLIQSSNFRLNEFRIRIELFQRDLAVIEHVHLERADDERQLGIYIDALAYDPAYYRAQGRTLKERLDRAGTIEVACAGTTLRYEGGMETARLNIGDYRGMKNVGGTFPIGEVFSEPKDLARVSGEAMIFAFAGIDHLVQMHSPFKIRIDRGVLIAHEGPSDFQAVLDQISAEEEVLVREFGIGLNRAMGKDCVLKDITAFERQAGLHLSLGEKHGIYPKPGLSPKKTHFHIDIFVDFERIDIDGQPVVFPAG